MRILVENAIGCPLWLYDVAELRAENLDAAEVLEALDRLEAGALWVEIGGGAAPVAVLRRWGA